MESILNFIKTGKIGNISLGVDVKFIENELGKAESISPCPRSDDNGIWLYAACIF